LEVSWIGTDPNWPEPLHHLSWLAGAIDEEVLEPHLAMSLRRFLFEPSPPTDFSRTSRSTIICEGCAKRAKA
jgi:hypothetical protein